jgi:phage internal scaffolding protein
MLSTDQVRVVGLDTGAESPVKASFADDCDVRKILMAFQRTGMIPHQAAGRPQYMEVPEMDLQNALEIIRQGDAAFAALSPEVRAEFGNPYSLLAALNDPGQINRLRSIGLLEPETPPAAASPEAVQGAQGGAG